MRMPTVIWIFIFKLHLLLLQLAFVCRCLSSTVFCATANAAAQNQQPKFSNLVLSSTKPDVICRARLATA